MLHGKVLRVLTPKLGKDCYSNLKVKYIQVV